MLLFSSTLVLIRYLWHLKIVIFMHRYLINAVPLSFQVGVIQHCELTMVGAQYSCKVARLETKDGCPLGPGKDITF
jgi:hypothetical protein